jgi:ribonuclease D
VLSNAAIAELAKKPPKTLKELANTPRVRGRFAREHGAEILGLIERLTQAANRGELPAEEAPTDPPDRAQRRREEALRAFRSEKAVQRKVTPSVVLNNGLVQDLAKSAPRTLEELARIPYLGEKRVRLYGMELIQLLSKNR